MAKKAPASPASKRLVAEAMLRAGLLAQARFKAMDLAKDHPSRDVYGLLTRIENADHQPLAAQEWQAKAGDAPLGEAWVCDTCRQPHAQWQLICKSCDGFNTLGWHEQPALIANQ
jgi:HemY protein